MPFLVIGAIYLGFRDGIKEQSIRCRSRLDKIAPNGRPAQIHAVLLENEDIALDDLFLKSFASSTPDLV